MTTKVQGSNGIEFPDATVQGSAAYTKAEADARYVAKVNGRTWKYKTISAGVAYTNNSGMDIELAITTTSPSGSSVMSLDSGIRICIAYATFNVETGMLYGTISHGQSFVVNGVSGSIATLTCAVLINGPVTGITP